MSILTAYDKFIQQALKYGFSLFGLPKTGQTTKYADGDDGDYQKGYPKKPPRFKDNGDGTITDNATGLMWVKDRTGAGCHNGTILIWPAAITFAEGLNFAGYSDWRLPNIKELQSIVDYGRRDPSIDPIFINTKSSYYWSSTTVAALTNFAWDIYFDSGFIDFYGKSNPYYVCPVRGGQ